MPENRAGERKQAGDVSLLKNHCLYLFLQAYGHGLASGSNEKDQKGAVI